MNKIELIVKKNNNGWSWVISNGYGLTWVWVFLGMGIKWVWVFLGMGVKWPNCTHPFGCGPPNLTSLEEGRVAQGLVGGRIDGVESAAMIKS